MLKSWYVQYAFLMLSLFAVTVGYNACSNEAAFNLDEEGNGLEQFTTPENPAPIEEPNVIVPKITINNDDEFTIDSVVSLSLQPTGDVTEMFISDWADCSKGSWEPFRKNKIWVLKKLNQKATIYAKYRFKDDPESSCVEDSIVHDDIAPTVQFIQGHDKAWISQAHLNVVFQAQDSGSGLKATQCDRQGNGQFQNCGSNILYANLIENQSYQLTVRAIDQAGNISAPKQTNWRSDRTPPSVIFNQVPAPVTADPTPFFSFLGNDIGSGVVAYQCQVDNMASYVACNNELTLPGDLSLGNFQDGNHSIKVRAIDAVGRVSAVVTYSWQQDSTVPTIQFTQTPKALENSKSARFSWQQTVGQPLSQYRCRVDSGSWQTCSSPRDLSNLSDGQHRFEVQGLQSTNGLDSSPIQFNWTIDTLAPSIQFTEVPSSIENTSETQIGFAAQDGESGIKQTYCKIDSQASFSPCSSPKPLTNLAEGNHTVSIRAEDNAGNLSPIVSHSWSIDKTGPLVSITSGPDDPTSSSAAEFSFVASDNGGSGVGHIECRVDGEAFALCQSPEMFNGFDDGSHNFSVRAIDKAGNLSAVKNYQWLVDSEGPELSFIFQPEAVEFVGSTPRVRFAADDGNGSGIQSFTCLYNSQPMSCAGDTTFDFPATAVSNHSFQVTVFDKVGNSSTRLINWEVKYQIVERQSSLMVNGDRPVDVLFVVDNSGSMDEERKNLGDRIDGFLGKLAGLDWQLAVTSTDLQYNEPWTKGKLAPFSDGSSYLTPTTNNSQALFGELVSNRTNQNPNGIKRGSGHEQGIHATAQVIGRFLNSESPHTSFIRDGADLAVVILSDEDENSNGTNVTYTPEQFLEFVDQSFNSQKNLTWHSMIVKPGDSACKNVGPDPHYYGVQYDALSRLTGFGEAGGAIIGSVCEQDYTSQLQDIGQSVRDMQKTIALQCEPVDDNQDGEPDIEVLYTPPGGSQSMFNEAFTVQGQKLVFQNLLDPGNYEVNYLCVK